MQTRTYSKTALGMLFGIFIGGAVAVLLFAITGNALSFTVAGVGVALGLILGAGWEQSEKGR